MSSSTSCATSCAISCAISCGLVGLPNVGKSTIFNALVKKNQAAAENFPFCTIKPNTGHVFVNDKRLDELVKISHSAKIVPALLECVDIAGLIKGAYKGEGLGNQFLGHIRECDMILHIVRCFKDDDIVHVDGDVNPRRDYDTICMELQFKDIDQIDKMLLQKKVIDKELLERARTYLSSNYLLNTYDWKKEELAAFTLHGLLTHKPMIVVANLSSTSDLCYLEQIADLMPIPIYASTEMLLQEIKSNEEREEMMKDFGLQQDGLTLVLQSAYKKLGLISFFTTGEMETRAWRVKYGATMQEAASVIHTDFYNSFISADVIKYDDFVKYKGWIGAREHGAVKTLSKIALVEDGDICIFKTYK